MNIKSAASAISIAVLLNACVSDGSVDKKARHVALQLAQLNFDPNTRSLTADNTKHAAIFLQQFYDLGKKDHADGANATLAQLRVRSFADAEIFTSRSQESTFVSQHYEAEQPSEQAALLLKSATETYWDGYNGKP